MEIRAATLDDITAITEVHKRDVATWYRGFGDDEIVAPYDQLCVFERYMAGGPWMSVETCAIHVNQLLLHELPPIVAVLDGKVVAESEFYIGDEGAPYGVVLDISVLYVHPDAQGRGVGGAMIKYLIDRAQRRQCRSMTVVPGPRGFYQHYGFNEVHDRPHLLVNARTTNHPYTMEELGNETPYRVVSGIPMPIGRYTSGRQEWERHKMITYHLPELSHCMHRRIRLRNDSGEAIAILAQHSPFDRALIAHAWTDSMPINELVTILRNECVNSGFSQLRLLIDPQIVRTPLAIEPVEETSTPCMMRWLKPRLH
ncbi:MAG: GNAT family N-acetyltransferase [Chloroflexi bacterium]|nr:GNAT family N-acetyltransferase [Chloroflexota bacterium]